MKKIILFLLILTNNIYGTFSVVNSCDNWVALDIHIQTMSEESIIKKNYQKIKYKKNLNYCFGINLNDRTIIVFIKYRNAIHKDVTMFDLSDYDMKKKHVQFIIKEKGIDVEQHTVY